MYKVILLVLIGLCCSCADEILTSAEPESEQATETVTSGQLGRRIRPRNDMVDMNSILQRLPSDSESIRENIIDSDFSCKGRNPGFYADIENECQIFHRCLEGQKSVFSFICPEETVFSQKALVCVWNETMDFDCADSEMYFEESNQAFHGNETAESAINDNVKNSTEINMNQSTEKSTETDNVEVQKAGTEIDDTKIYKTVNTFQKKNIFKPEIKPIRRWQIREEIKPIQEVKKVVSKFPSVSDVETFKPAELKKEPEVKPVEPKPIRRWQIREEIKPIQPIPQTLPVAVEVQPINDISSVIANVKEIMDEKEADEQTEDIPVATPETDNNDIDVAQTANQSEKLVEEPAKDETNDTIETVAQPQNSDEELPPEIPLIENRARSHLHRFLFKADA